MEREAKHREIHRKTEQVLARRARSPEETRQAILLAAFEEMHSQGFRAASLQRILQRVGVTKGALYHHFRNKEELGYAVIDEVIWGEAREMWQHLLEGEGHVVDRMQELLRAEMHGADEHSVVLGCPVNNLAQELSSIEEGFRERLHRIQSAWRDALTEAVERGKAAGQIRPDVDARSFATLMVASFEGCNGIAKCARSTALYSECLQAMIDQLDNLRA